VLLRGAPGEGAFKNIIFLPRILAPTVVGVLWFYVYAPDGVLNRALGFVSGSEVDIGWLYQDNTVTGAIIATFVWQSVGLVAGVSPHHLAPAHAHPSGRHHPVGSGRLHRL